MLFTHARSRGLRALLAQAIALAMVVTIMQVATPQADAAGPPYDGPTTADTGPAYFGPAPNPIPYCDNPTYFDPFPENVNPIGRINVDGAPNASVTTDGITMDFELTAEGTTDSQYPGFFPFGGEGDDGDQPKGVEMAGSDAATVELSEPLFYTQWVFTDVDRENEGFDVVPAWTDPLNPGAVAVFGGDDQFDFAGTSDTVAQFNDLDQVGHPSESINGRVQVDFIGALQSLTMTRDAGSGQSGFAVGGGCSPIGAAKELTSGPTWNGSSYDVTYTIRVRNNLPSTTTLLADVNAALLAAESGTSAGDVEGIDMTDVGLTDVLTDGAFDSIVVVDLTNESGNITTNTGFNGTSDTALIADGQTIPAESEETFTLALQYVPSSAGALGDGCVASYDLLNQAEVSGTASGVDVDDLSDDGADPDPGVSNGAGGNDDPTVVTFDCRPADPVLEIVKTVVAGPGGTCPDFAGGTPGDGDALNVIDGDTVTYCISVRNTGDGDASNVIVTDPQAPAGFDGSIGALASGAEADALSFDLDVDLSTPAQNVATVNGDGPSGPVSPVNDSALIEVSAQPLPAISVSNTVTDTDCASTVEGTDELHTDAPGEAFLWCFTITNTGTTALTNIVADAAVAGLTSVDVLATYGGGAASLASGASIVFEVASTVPASAATNSIQVTADASEADGTPLAGLDPVSDTNDASVEPLLSGALAIVKTAVAGADAACPTFDDGTPGQGAAVAVTSGDTVTYCISVENIGTADVTGVVVTDPQAPGSFDVGTLTPGQEASLSYALVVDGNSPTVNTATANGNTGGDPLSPISDDALISVGAAPAASIAITKTVVAADGDCSNAVEGVDELVEAAAGTAVLWCIVVTNDGNVPVADVRVTDLPIGLDDVDVLAVHGGGAASLAAGGSVSFAVEGTIPTDGLSSTAVVAAVGSQADGTPLPGLDPIGDDNDAGVAVLGADLSLVKTVSNPGPVPAGTVITYTVAVTNAGPEAAADVVVTDTMPAGVTVASLPMLAGWSCSQAAGVLTCARAEAMPAAATETLSYTATVTAAAAVGVDLVNTATVTTSTPDPTPGNNTDTGLTRRIAATPGSTPANPGLPDPGPFNNPPPPADPVPAAPEPLAFTGTASTLLISLAAAMTAFGGLMAVGARRARRDEFGF